MDCTNSLKKAGVAFLLLTIPVVALAILSFALDWPTNLAVTLTSSAIGLGIATAILFVMSRRKADWPSEATRKICHDFIREFSLENRPELVSGVGISMVGLKDATLHGEKDDDCLCVLLIKPLPESWTFPERYQGLRVFTEVTGEIVLGQ